MKIICCLAGLCLSMTSALGADCPPAGEQHRYLDVPINFEAPQEGTFKLHFKFLNGFAFQKRTLILLHGGPGDNMESFETCPGSQCFSELFDQFNVVTMDERGAGCSPLPPGTEKQFMTTLATAEDIEALRGALVGQDGMISVYGISYGTVVGIVYTSRHEKHVERLILEGSVSDNRYLIHNAFGRYFEEMLAVKPETREQWLSLRKKLEEQKLKISTDDFEDLREFLVKSYRGLWKVLPQVISELDRDKYDTWDRLYALISAIGSGFDDGNQAFNYVWCRELFDIRDSEMLANKYGQIMSQRCAAVMDPAFDPPKYDSTNYATFNTPTLLITGRWDGVAPADYNGSRIVRKLSSARFFEVPFAGHGVMWERRDCDISLISSFLSDGLTPALDRVFNSDLCQRE